MYLVLTIVACCITLFLMLIEGKKRFQSLLRLFLIYLGATLMWMVDVIFVTIEGEKFFVYNHLDMLLGIVVVFAGMAVHFVLSGMEKRRLRLKENL